MSIIKVDTNVPASGINEAFCEQITESLAKTFKKSKSVSLSIDVTNYLWTCSN